MSRIKEAQVTLRLNGEDYTLKPTLNAMESINDNAGDPFYILERIARADFRTISTIIQHGANLRQKQEIREMRENLFREGVANVANDVVSFLEMLTWGGREQEPSLPEGDDGGNS